MSLPPHEPQVINTSGARETVAVMTARRSLENVAHECASHFRAGRAVKFLPALDLDALVYVLREARRVEDDFQASLRAPSSVEEMRARGLSDDEIARELLA